jgi:hypothetical protein
MKSVILQHVGTWVMSLVLGLLVWAVLVTEAVEEREVEIVVRVTGVDPDRIAGWRLLDRDNQPLRDDKMRIKLRGPKGVLRNLNPSGMQYLCMVSMAELERSKENPYKISVVAENFLGVPTDATVLVESREIRLAYELYVEAVMQLIPPSVEGAPAMGYGVERVAVVPDRVRVRLPESAFQRLSDPKMILLRPVSVANRAEDVVGPAVPQDPTVLLREAAEARVSIAIKKVRAELRDVKIHVMFNPETNIAEIQLVGDKTCTLVVEGKDLAVERLATTESFHVYAYVDHTLAAESENLERELQWKVNVPDVEVKEVIPRTVTLKAIRK